MLTTQRLILRGPREGDLDDMFAIFSEPRVMRFWSTAPHADKSVTQKMLEYRIPAFTANPRYFQIEKDGHVIGCAGNHKDDEVGFILHADHWHQGIITEAMGALVPDLWETTDHTRLTADADPLNAASVGLLTSLGFVETHRAKNTFCINGVWADSVYFKLDRPTPRA